MAAPAWQYYDEHADAFEAATAGLDLSALRARFTDLLPRRADILDAGCGVGRDALAFRAAGHRVVAFDASEEMARRASRRLGVWVERRTFAGVDWRAAFDGVWCCASLLFLSDLELRVALRGLARACRPGGVLYVSFKLGRGPRPVPDGRVFYDRDENGLAVVLGEVPELCSIDVWRTRDVRAAEPVVWLNALLRR